MVYSRGWEGPGKVTESAVAVKCGFIRTGSSVINLPAHLTSLRSFLISQQMHRSIFCGICHNLGLLKVTALAEQPVVGETFLWVDGEFRNFLICARVPLGFLDLGLIHPLLGLGNPGCGGITGNPGCGGII